MFNRDILFNNMGWCLVEKNPTNHVYHSLVEELYRVQYYSEAKESNYDFPRANIMPTIDRKYWLTNDERKLAEFILAEFKQYLIDRYFTECLTVTKRIRKMRSGEYFLFMLCIFLEKGKDEYSFRNYDIRTYKGRDKYYKYYELTEFGMIYYKCLIIATTYCLVLYDNNNADDAGYLSNIRFHLDNYLKEFDTKTLTFWV